MRARIRTVKPEMWEDERIVALSRDARLLLIGLITMADDEGRFRARRSTILGKVFPGDDDAVRRVDGWIREIQEQGLIVFYVEAGTPYGAFRHWKRHQKINRPRPSDLPPPPNHDVVRENSVHDHDTFSEDALNNHGVFTPSRAGARSDPDPDPEVVQRLCDRLAAHISRNDPKASPRPTSDRWRTDMRLLLRDRDATEVERIIDWCQANDFWRANILSPGKLRSQFTQLAIKANGPSLRAVAAMRPGHLTRSPEEIRAAYERRRAAAASNQVTTQEGA